MKPHNRIWLLAAFLVLAMTCSALGQLTDYQLATSTTTYSAITGATEVINSSGTSGVYNESATAGPYNIGFNFSFNGTAYSQFTVSTAGLLVLGSSTSSSFANYLESPPVSSPIIVAYWDHAHMYDGNATSGGVCTTPAYTHVSYVMTGTAPNRVLTVEWGSQLYNDGNSTYYYGGDCLPMHNYQIRLYEGTNAISFTYGHFRQTTNSAIAASASIGLAQGSNNFLSITPGTTASVSFTTANNSVDNYYLSSPTLIAEGTVYTLTPCGLKVTGRTGVGNGGTVTMANGDSLFTGFAVQRGNEATYTPFSLSTPATGCPTVTYSLNITGASDYYFGTPGTQTATGTVGNGSTVLPQITFRPTATGTRIATLTVTDITTNISRNYVLRASGATRIQWIGNTAQGGTVALLNGDTLLYNINVIRRTTRNFMPMTLTNINTNAAQTPLANITYSINDPSGQYSIIPPSATLGASQSSTPTITFTPTGVGSQPATLTVNADGETRTFVLYAFSAAPGAEFILGGTKLGPGVGAFINYTGCLGETANTQALTINNIGVGDVTVDQIDFFLTDTVYKQGTPGYPLLRDQNNNLIRSRDYYITTQPGVAPMTPAQFPALPIVVPTGKSRTVYLTFVGQYPGKRFARAFIQTNAQNFMGTDAGGNQVEGLLNFDLFAHATGSSLSDNSTGGLPKAVSFPETSAGDSVDATVTIYNTGICDLRISKKYLKIFSGDVNEFKIVSAFPGTPTNGDDYVFGPGMNGTLTVRFLPSRSGTRRATVWMRTNDSTIYIPGVTNRGDYFLDLFGPGKAGLDVPDVTFQPAIIDGENSIAEAMVVNSSTELLGIAQIRIIGPDAAEFAENPARKWPTPLPKAVQPGEELRLSVVHTATSGSAPGPRQAKLEITLTNGQVIIVELSGAAWTRTASASLSKPFTQTTIGALQRRVIRIENTGWAPLVLQMPTLTGVDASEFAIGNLSRMVLDSGQVEFLEVTYAPTRAGTATATVNIMSNATNGAQTVTLSGSAKTARGDEGVDDGAITIGRENEDGDAAQTGTSGVGSGVMAGVLELRQSVPNPASGNVKISYVLAQRGQVSLVLYDERGIEVQKLVAGAQESGEHAVTVDVSGLASGVYHYRLEVNGRMVSRTMRVVH